MGGLFFLFRGGELNNKKKLQKLNTTKALDGRHLIFCHTTTNQKHVGVTEGGWFRPCDHARTLGEHDGIDEPLAEGNQDGDDEYGTDGNISNNDNEYAVVLPFITYVP
jgi:hypothetical protein